MNNVAHVTFCYKYAVMSEFIELMKLLAHKMFINGNNKLLYFIFK
jgi:hypothetical protein